MWGKEKMGLENVPRCQHVKVNGVQCASPALRRKRHCYFHERADYERKLAAQDTSAQRSFGLPLLEDANSIQIALMKIVQMLGAGTLDTKCAGLMLYALQTASVNLRHVKFEPEKINDIVIDEDTVDLTRLSSPQWSSGDFPAEEREKTKHEIDPPLLPAEPLAPRTVSCESLDDLAARRNQKRNLLPYSEDDSKGEPTLAKILLRRLIPGWQEQKIGEEPELRSASPPRDQ